MWSISVIDDSSAIHFSLGEEKENKIEVFFLFLFFKFYFLDPSQHDQEDAKRVLKRFNPGLLGWLCVGF